MEPTLSTRQSCNIVVGMVTYELNLECNGKIHKIAMCRLCALVRGLVTSGDYHVVRRGRDGRVDDGFGGGSKDLMQEKNEGGR